MKNKESRGLDHWIPFLPWGILFMMWTLFWGLHGLVTQSYMTGFVQIVIFVMIGLLYGWGYCRTKKILLNYDMEKINKTDEDTFSESIPDEKAIQNVDVKFDLSELGSANMFLVIKISSTFIDEFKKYNLSLNSPTILGKKIYEWGDCENGICVQNVLCFSKAEIKSTIEQVTNEVYTAIEWLPNKNGDQSICIQKWVMFEWK